MVDSQAIGFYSESAPRFKAQLADFWLDQQGGLPFAHCLIFESSSLACALAIPCSPTHQFV
jgi:hypothetical protein